MSRVLVMVACGLALAGCAGGGTSDLFKFEPAKVNVQFQSDPPGAEARTSSGEACKTPCTVGVAPDKDFTVTFSLAGYEPQTVQVTKNTDALEASMDPNPVAVEMAKAQPAKRQPRKRAATTASAAKPATRPATTRSAPPPAAAPATAPAAPPPSASDPWPAVR